MSTARCSLRVTPTDTARIERLRDRIGPRTAAAEAARLAAMWLVRQRPRDLTEAATRLAEETQAAAEELSMWGFTLPTAEMKAIDAIERAPPSGMVRTFSRNQFIRIALMLVDALPDSEITLAAKDLPRLQRGRVRAANVEPS